MAKKTQRDSAGNAARQAPTAVDASAPGTAGLSHLSHNGPDQRRIESWSIEGLKQHYRQATTFHDLDDAEFEGLVESIGREGLREPIQVTPDGVIIDGHQRARAARRLGWTEIRAWVRDDLAGDQDAIDRAHINANRNRRQLGPVDMVRLARRLAEMEPGRKPGQLDDRELKALSGHVAEQMDLSPRHAQRLLNISCIPMPIQRAYSAGRLTVVAADQVSRLDSHIQLRLAEAIEAGGDPAEIVAPHVAALKRPVRPDHAYERLLAEMERGMDALEGREDQIQRSVFAVDGDLQLFERLTRFQQIFAPILTRRVEEYKRGMAELYLEFGGGGPIDGSQTSVA